jgi:hypothetical protein
MLSKLRLEVAQGLPFLLGSGKGGLRNQGVDPRPGDSFEEFGPVFGAGLDEGVEITLDEKDRAAELVEAEADPLCDLLQGVGLLSPMIVPDSISVNVIF